MSKMKEKRKGVGTGVWVDPELDEWLRSQAQMMRWSKSQVIREILVAAMDTKISVFDIARNSGKGA